MFPPENPTEIICEIDPTDDHPQKSTAIAVIESSAPHFHRISTETYKVLKGNLKLIDGNETFRLKEGESHTVHRGSVHSATADSAWVEVRSVPGWTPQDHHLVFNSKE